jgi:hypothetical protein
VDRGASPFSLFLDFCLEKNVVTVCDPCCLKVKIFVFFVFVWFGFLETGFFFVVDLKNCYLN